MNATDATHIVTGRMSMGADAHLPYSPYSDDELLALTTMVFDTLFATPLVGVNPMWGECQAIATYWRSLGTAM